MQTQDATEQEQRKLVFRVPASLHEQIQEHAEAEDRSMASWIRRVLEKAVAEPRQT